MKTALQLVGLFALGSAVVHLYYADITWFALSMVVVALCSIGAGYIDYSRRQRDLMRAYRDEVWQRRTEMAPGVCYRDEPSPVRRSVTYHSPHGWQLIKGGKEPRR